MKKILVLCAAFVAAGLPLFVVSGVVSVFLGQGNGVAFSEAADPTVPAAPSIPPAMLELYQQAAATCAGLDWTVLAAIGTVESANGTSNLPGVLSGQNPAGAEGPMQFEPATFVHYAQPVPAGGADPPSPYDPVDAVYAAARMLCANGAANPETAASAIFAYDHSETYVQTVLRLAALLRATTPGASENEPAGIVAAGFALAQVGTPYRWGTERSGYGFDCSGLAQAAWRAAGISIPRVAQDQFDNGLPLAAGSAPEPGDLVFFGSGPSGVTHVGIVVGDGVMVDAPHAGSVVRVERFSALPGARWGDEEYVGAVRPGR